MPASAQQPSVDNEFVVLSGSANVPAGEEVGDLVVFHGSSNVEGIVNGSLTAFDAPVTISGQVNGDVVWTVPTFVPLSYWLPREVAGSVVRLFVLGGWDEPE
jgi:hypothetical protein